MPILTLSSSKSVLDSNLFRPTHMYINTNFLQRCGYMAPWPLPHRMLNFASIPQTFSVTCRIALSASRHSYKARIPRAIAINEQVILRTSPARGQSTIEKWRSAKGVVTTRFPSSEEQTTLSPKHSSRPRYMILATLAII